MNLLVRLFFSHKATWAPLRRILFSWWGRAGFGPRSVFGSGVKKTLIIMLSLSTSRSGFVISNQQRLSVSEIFVGMKKMVVGSRECCPVASAYELGDKSPCPQGILFAKKPLPN